MELLQQGVILLLPPPSPRSSSNKRVPSHISALHQAQMDIPQLEVHPPCFSYPDIPCPMDTQYIGKYDVGKDNGPLRVPSPVEDPPIIPLLGLP